MKVAVTWEMCGYVDIPNAKTLEDAMKIFNDESENIELPSDGEYVDGSFRLSSENVSEQAAMTA